MDQELKTAIENSNKLIETQRTAIESKADAETVKRIEADLAKALEEKAAIETRLAEVETKMARPGAPGTRVEVDEHKAAFISFLRKSQDSSAKAALESKAANISIAGGAGIAVPSVIESAVLTQLVNENPLRGLARVISVSTPDYTEILDRANAGTAWVGETDTRGTTTAPDLAAIQPKFGTLHATVEVSQQALEDMAFNVESWLVSSLAERFGNAEGVAFVSGDGVNKPAGLLNGTVFGTVKSGAAANLGADVPTLTAVVRRQFPHQPADLFRIWHGGQRQRRERLAAVVLCHPRQVFVRDGLALFPELGRIRVCRGCPVEDLCEALVNDELPIFGDDDIVVRDGRDRDRRGPDRDVVCSAALRDLPAAGPHKFVDYRERLRVQRDLRPGLVAPLAVDHLVASVHHRGSVGLGVEAASNARMDKPEQRLLRKILRDHVAHHQPGFAERDPRPA